jgi:hypothetical protein
LEKIWSGITHGIVLSQCTVIAVRPSVKAASGKIGPYSERPAA